MITQDQARGDSIGLSEEDYRLHAKRGAETLNSILFPVDTVMRDQAWNAVQPEWGGVTIDMPDQIPYVADTGYALKCCGSPFPWNTLSIPFDALTRERFNETYALAIERFGGAPFIGIFRDEDTQLVEFDAVCVVHSEQEARDIATYCESLGGAYDYSTGNGVFPYHVKGLYRVGESLRYLPPDSQLATDLVSTSKGSAQ